MVLRLPWVPPKHRRCEACAQGLEIRVDSVQQNVEALGRCWGPRSQRWSPVGDPKMLFFPWRIKLANWAQYSFCRIFFWAIL